MSTPVQTDFFDEEILEIQAAEPPSQQWTLYFDGALNRQGAGIGVALLTLEGVLIPRAVQLNFTANTNNIAEYEALILGLRLALELGAQRLKLIGDSYLVLRQILNKYRTLNPRLETYKGIARLLLARFQQVVYVHTLRSHNLLADALASLASSIEFPINTQEQTIMVQQHGTSVTDSTET